MPVLNEKRRWRSRGSRKGGTAAMVFAAMMGLVHGVAAEGPPAEALKDVHWQVREDFRDADWEKRWWVETQGAVVRSTPEGLAVTNAAQGETGGTTVWFREPLPADIVVHVVARTLEPVDGNACNFNMVLAAREADGSPLKPGRSGDYPELHVIPNIIITLTGGFQKGWSRVRRDPGFRQISEAKERSEPGREYDLAYRLNGGLLEMWGNGVLWHRWQDPEPLRGGNMGLRTWRSNVLFEKVEIGFIVSPEE